MVVRSLLEQTSVFLQPGDDFLVGIENVLASEVGDQRVEFATLIHRDDYRNAGGLTNPLVVFTVGRCLVNDAGAIAFANVVVDQNLPSGFGAKTFGVGVIVEDALVANATKFRALYGFRDGCDRLVSGFKPKFLGVVAHE